MSQGETDLQPADFDLWDECLQRLRTNVPEPAWMTCFRHIHPLQIDPDKVLLAVPTPTLRTRIYNRYYQTLLAGLAEIGVDEALVEIVVRDDLPAPPEDGVAIQSDLNESFEAAAEQQRRQTQDEQVDHLPGLFPASENAQLLDELGSTAADVTEAGAAIASPANFGPGHSSQGQPRNGRYTFENFVVGSSNRFAHAAAIAVAETPDDNENYNPLVIYGDVGLGKTHLLQAIATYVREHQPEKSVRYVTTETFLNEFIEGMSTRQREFKQRYRNVDVLLLDDIQIIEGKEAFQEELFNTFNDLHNNNSLIVMSSDRPPNTIATLSKRLTSRFEWGLMVDIQSPSLELRLAILRKKNDNALPDEVLQVIAEHITSNIRELEGAHNRISALAKFGDKPVTPELAEAVLGATHHETKKITPSEIVQASVSRSGYTQEQLFGQTRQKSLVTARHICMYVMRELTSLSLPDIGDIFGNRNHTTVLHAVKKIQQAMHDDREVLDEVTQIIDDLKAA